ncbi:pyruvate, water dikinase [Desulfurobacterium atlanticum]|uniref:Phosphoenolpyruvate synthase n=1 Tax=Desulfurobacterium atlanticum TaxID=240169 RepID=A0A238XZB0_9BACT|nr:pyruvate, water dikinase [Desulfurobacterium atlanticum]SNR64386.1 phosphoenolpyruvate synthase [Desulfurobacterium atlanticum]
MKCNSKFVLWLKDVDLNDVSLVGGKNASLGEMIKNLAPEGINIPDGFVVTAKAYFEFLEFNNLKDKIKNILTGIDVKNIKELQEEASHIRAFIKQGDFPSQLRAEIVKFYRSLSEKYGMKEVDVAVRSSATAEDLPDASFAGQQETYLNIRGEDALLGAIKNCFASLFTARAISYRESFGFDHFKVGISVGVQKMVRSDMGASGVSFSLDTETGFKNVVVINGIYGLGELIVGGEVVPDEFVVFKPTLKEGFNAIIEKKLGDKDRKLIYTEDGQGTVIVPVDETDKHKFCLSDEEILKLSRWVVRIEEHYSKFHARWCPMDVEWAKDGITGELFIVQARPETVQSQKDYSKLEIYKVNLSEEERKKKILLKGIAVGHKVASGRIKKLSSPQDAVDFKEGEILVAEITDPDWEPVMKKAAAIVTEKGGRTCHAAIVARELGVPAVVGARDAMKILEDNETVTVSCAEGNEGYIYEGEIPFSIETVDISSIPEVDTPVLFNVATPDRAFELSFLPSDGVGLAREEFIINNYIGVHPLALLNFDFIKEKDSEVARVIEEKLYGFNSPEEFYISKLSYGIAKIAAAFYPKPVIVRFSDFKTNEYANLLGGKYFEPAEENPMLGWRGASRYYSERFKEAFGLECLAIKRVREEMGLKNVIVMVPFCRTVEEGRKVLEVMKEYGLERGKDGLQVYVMCEIPSNVILAEQFAEIFDGFSIGSNDLTQLTLGVDRDSELVASVYDERNDAVKYMVAMVIEKAKKMGRKVGICGQAPSDYPEFTQFLIEKGIDTISINPDALLKTKVAIAEIEKKLKN